MKYVIDVPVVDVSADMTFVDTREKRGFHEKMAQFKVWLMPFDGVELDLWPKSMLINTTLD